MSRSEYQASLDMQHGYRETLVNGIPMSEWVKRDRATARKVAEFKATRPKRTLRDWFTF